jgi:hypothetical protein
MAEPRLELKRWTRKQYDLEVRRAPAPSDTAPYGWDYRQLQVLRAGERVTPLAAPDVTIAVSDFLPERRPT